MDILKEIEPRKICKPCVKGKPSEKPFPESTTRAAKQLDLLHSDLCGPMPTCTASGYRYFQMLVDDHLRFTVLKLIKSKDDVAGVIRDYMASFTTLYERKPKVLRTNNGREYVKRALTDFLKKEGIRHQLSVPKW